MWKLLILSVLIIGCGKEPEKSPATILETPAGTVTAPEAPAAPPVIIDEEEPVYVPPPEIPPVVEPEPTSHHMVCIGIVCDGITLDLKGMFIGNNPQAYVASHTTTTTEDKTCIVAKIRVVNVSPLFTATKCGNQVDKETRWLVNVKETKK